MLPPDVIAIKRDGRALNAVQIRAFVRGATDGTWADYQLSAMLMAIYLRGMNAEETAVYTDAVMRSGSVADLQGLPGTKVDKHSTGGVGDKVSLHLAPMVAACGVPVPMIAGRGLGHTGGTIDKLESIPGFRTGLSLNDYRAQVGRIGCAIISQTRELAPADRKLYALRDVTATVESRPLICASIMAKKLAEGVDALVLDVKFGRGAFMKDRAEARELARAMVGLGLRMGRRTRALLTRMDQPLGRSVGNALEVAESLQCLRGKGPEDLMTVTYALGAQMLILGGAARDESEARDRLEESVSSGAALAKFRELVAAQGGEAATVDEPARLPEARLKVPVPNMEDGYIREVDARGVARAALRLGAGRSRTDDAIDHAVGVAGLVKAGERVSPGQPLAVIHARDEGALADAERLLREAITFSHRPVDTEPLVAELIQ